MLQASSGVRHWQAFLLTLRNGQEKSISYLVELSSRLVKLAQLDGSHWDPGPPADLARLSKPVEHSAMHRDESISSVYVLLASKRRASTRSHSPAQS